MKANKVIRVFFDKKLVGTLAFTPSHKVAFEYFDDWLQNGFSISPFSLPLKEQVFIPTKLQIRCCFTPMSAAMLSRNIPARSWTVS